MANKFVTIEVKTDEKEPNRREGTPENCATCGKPEELRPYGANGAWVCFHCAMATPESKAEAVKRMHAALDAAGPVPVIGVGGPPMSLAEARKRHAQ